MPTIPADRLKALSETIFQGAGVSAVEAEIVARHCIDANLAGHDSHGVLRVITYCDRVEKGHIVPGAKIEIEKESPTTLVVNGNWGFGFTVTETITKKLIEKAKTQNVAVGTIHYQGHIGRLADYPLMAIEEGMIGMITADSGRSPKRVAPFGGIEPKLGTNPICMAFPSNLDAPFYFDMATCAGAAGKLEVAEARGEHVPEGWLIDKHGNPTTDPSTVKDGGAIKPMGGNEGYKGYALAAMVEILSGLLTGLGF
ncbi:MAG: Ldh family oxidoreductase, partial [Pseudomonadota bacterium]|nr:Ldh family oxidoreductase [Pseudomonadota bacterium]